MGNQIGRLKKKVGFVWGRMFWVEREAGALVSTDSKKTSVIGRGLDR